MFLSLSPSMSDTFSWPCQLYLVNNNKHTKHLVFWNLERISSLLSISCVDKIGQKGASRSNGNIVEVKGIEEKHPL